MGDRPDLSLVMPAYNEGDAIEETIGRVDRVVGKLGLRYELIVVDDGSVDDTRRKAINCASKNSHVRVVGYGRNEGKGYAIKTGFSRAKGDIVIFMDGDLDINPAQIGKYLKALKQADIVIASKRHPGSRVKAPPLRRLLSLTFHVLVRLATGLRVSDTQSGLKAFKGKPLQRMIHLLSVKKFAFDVEALTVANLMNLRIVEMPVRMELNSGFALRHMFSMLVDLAGITYRLRVKRWYQSNLNNVKPMYKPVIRR